MKGGGNLQKSNMAGQRYSFLVGKCVGGAITAWSSKQAIVVTRNRKQATRIVLIMMMIIIIIIIIILKLFNR